MSTPTNEQLQCFQTLAKHWRMDLEQTNLDLPGKWIFRFLQEHGLDMVEELLLFRDVENNKELPKIELEQCTYIYRIAQDGYPMYRLELCPNKKLPGTHFCAEHSGFTISS